jgi:hypothetical protein
MMTFEAQMAKLVELYRMYQLSKRGGAFVPFPSRSVIQVGRLAARTPMAPASIEPAAPGEGSLLSSGVSYQGRLIPAPFVGKVAWAPEAFYPLIGGIPASWRASLM